MDEMDKKILRILQDEGDLTVAELGTRVGLSQMPAWRRLRRLKETGVISRIVAIVDKRLVGYTTIAFVMLRTRQHDKAWFAKLRTFVERETIVVEFHRLSGEIDFLLKVVLRDMDDYRGFYDRLTSAVELLDVSTAFAFEGLKEQTRVPIS
ncbi:Lrp/AsnC family transcriptional regulator [Tardiphaga sp. OK246]|uniref:Lrp/AsnC family transcriptional regulator n=1 Tax=Tardiphaga sp. OK246 TaxID=1855307 RepID=UPI000B690901|nr:Lrp/AsnC family transcriptional regulator [Tardiphaga sp. OK246]SNT32558.1 Lrp/AsnC family transcriptional regulator [Tardiphaga sp. OK246]